MADRRLWGMVFSILMVVFFIACSSSEELNSTGEADSGDGAFEQVDTEEAIIPETDEPIEIEVVEDEEVPETETPVPVRTPAEEAASRKDAPARQETPPPAPAKTTQTTPEPVSVAPRSGSMMWSVQLGAFKNESGAFDLVEELKKKFNQPVYKRYDPATGYYKVTLGSFQTREQAGTYKLEVQSQGYPDAFTVEVAR